MRIHREGRVFILMLLIIAIGLTIAALVNGHVAFWIAGLGSWFLFFFTLQFFRDPMRLINIAEPETIFAPADGRVVMIEKVYDKEYFNDERTQVSIFMSPLNVHINRVPVSGTVSHVKYYPGKYLVAWHPKSSELNERCVSVIDTGSTEILIRQIAGAVARRIVCYMQPGAKVEKGAELGFIKFGSRCDILFPVGTEITVKLNENVKGNLSPIARLFS